MVKPLTILGVVLIVVGVVASGIGVVTPGFVNDQIKSAINDELMLKGDALDDFFKEADVISMLADNDIQN